MSSWWFARSPGATAPAVEPTDAVALAAPPANADRHRQQVRAEQVRLLFQQLPAALTATTIVGALVVYVLWRHVSIHWLLLWLLALTVTTVVRAALIRAYVKAQPLVGEAGRWVRRFL